MDECSLLLEVTANYGCHTLYMPWKKRKIRLLRGRRSTSLPGETALRKNVWDFNPFSSWSNCSFLSVWIKTVGVGSTTEMKRERRAGIEASHGAHFPSPWNAVGDNSQDRDERLSLLGWCLSVLPLSSSTVVATFSHPPAHPTVAEARASLILGAGERQST